MFFEIALSIMPNYAPAMFGKWYADVSLCNLKKTESYMKTWISDHSEFRCMVAEAAQKLILHKKYETIIYAIEPIVDLLDHAISYSALGSALIWANRLDEAENNLEKTLVLDKTVNAARINLAQIKQVYRKDNLAAAKLFKEALIYDPLK